MGEFDGFGFAPGVVRGVRSFKVDKLGRLTGVHYPQVWRPGENDADCRKREDPYSAITVTLDRRYSSALYSTYTTVPKSGGFWNRTRDVVVRSEPEPVPEPVEPPHSYEECKCGFYAYYDGSDDYQQKGYVSGVVEGYGETIIGTRGFRAMKARIVALRIPKSVADHLALRVASNYADVPLFARFGEMVAAFPPDGGGAEVSPATDPEFWTREA